MTLFFELLQVAIGNRKSLSAIPTVSEWKQIFQLCHKHSLLGIGFCGMRILPDEQLPPKELMFRWTAQADLMLQNNAFMNQECERLCQKLQSEGMEGRVIKGQSNYLYYPSVPVSSDPAETETESLGSYRTPGDIDVLTRPADHKQCVRRVIEYCLNEASQNGRTVHHTFYHDTELCWKGESEVEAHYRAIWLNAPWRNAVLQRWLKQESQWTREEVEVEGSRFYVATVEFNVIYHLLHVFKHLFEEGIGLRQLLDYYMVLRAWTLKHRVDIDTARKAQMRLLRRFDCDRFAAAMMFVLQQVFALPDEYLLCKPDEDRGAFLLEEVLRAGNFGHFDERLVGHREYVTLWHAWDKLGRNMKYVTQYPEEVLGEPLFSIYHWCWRTFRLWRF